MALDKSLALKKIVDHDEVDPRERQLPKGQVPERTSIPLRDALYPLPYPSASLCSRLITPAPGRHFLCRSAAADHRRSPALLVGEMAQFPAAANILPAIARAWRGCSVRKWIQRHRILTFIKE